MSARRPRKNNRRCTSAREEERSTDHDEGAGEKTKQKKRKLSDLLGPPWSEDDLKKFYLSYRQHGRDWKKVTAMFHDRTVEMVEVLYNMNKAYLSLPEGAASAAGLIAMMTDHYNILNASNAGQQGNHVSGLSTYGGPSPAKRPRIIPVNWPRVVGKRTPRVPLWHDRGELKSGKLPVVESMGDAELDSLGHCDELKVAMALVTSASQRAVSPEISCTPVCRADMSRNFAAQNGYATVAGSGSSGTKHTGSNMDDGVSDASMDTETGVASISTAVHHQKMSSCAAGEAKSTPRSNQKFHAKRGKLHGLESCRSDELNEECSCTEEGTLKHEDAKGLYCEQASKKKRSLSQKVKKRNRQLFCGDERSGLDALATLADLSLNGLLPSPRDPDEPGMKSLELSKESPLEGILWTRENCSEPWLGLSKESLNHTAKRIPAGWPKEPHSRLDIGGSFNSDFQKGVSATQLKRRKRKGLPDKTDQSSNINIRDMEVRVDVKALNVQSEDLMGCSRVRRAASGQNMMRSSGWQVKEEPDQEAGQDVDVDKCKVPQVGIVTFRNRRKTKWTLSSTQILSDRCSHAKGTEEVFSNKVRLTHCLSSEKVRQWCLYEWFYSAIDLPWFLRNEFVEYLNHASLGHVPRLTRAEWGVIRGSLGKPRRLSKKFLQEERQKLDEYRESVRKHYQEVRVGQRDGLPTDLPRPLIVGQRVIALHPRSKEVYNGSILTVDHNKCRVQFDQPEMGVELVEDIECMPVNSFENLSDALIRKSIVIDAGCRGMDNCKHHVKSWVAPSASPAARATVNQRLDKPASVSISSSSSSSLLNALCKQAQAADTVDCVLQVKAAANEAAAAAQQAMFNWPCSLAQVRAKEADIRALSDLTRALDKKEAILLELRNMNNDADANGEVVRRSEMFQKQYATLILQLKEVNELVCGALLHLRQRNKYQENRLPPWHQSSVQATLGSTPSGNFESNSNSFSLEQFPLAKGVTLHAKHCARLMVNTAVETMLSIKEGEDALSKIGIALNQLPKSSFNVLQGDGVQGDVMTAGKVSSGVDWGDGDVSGAVKPGNGQDTLFLADLMSTCIATLLMVQAFTERQFPPAEIARAFDAILASIRPSSSQNYQIYSEIQHYASLLKNQIIALIPTQALPLDCPPIPH